MIAFPRVLGAPFKFVLNLIGLDGAEGQEALGDWHNLEHILYNMLVKVFVTQNETERVYPDLALLNADGDRISNDVAELKRLPYVSPDFESVQANWNQLWRGTLTRYVRRNNNTNDLIMERVAQFNVSVTQRAEEYRNIYFKKDIFDGRPKSY